MEMLSNRSGRGFRKRTKSFGPADDLDRLRKGSREAFTDVGMNPEQDGLEILSQGDSCESQYAAYFHQQYLRTRALSAL